jgi:hypothetical protein
MRTSRGDDIVSDPITKYSIFDPSERGFHWRQRPAGQRSHSHVQLRSLCGGSGRERVPPSFEDLEIVVVDDGSTDETADTLHPLLDRIRYTVGWPPREAREFAWRADRTWPFSTPTISGCPRRCRRRSHGWTAIQLSDLCTARPPCSLRRLRGRRPSWAYHPSGKILPWLVRQNVVPSPTPMVRRELFDQVGPFDETLSACEDWDMWIRIPRAERRRRCPWDWQHGAELSRHALMTAYDLTFYLFTAFHSRPRSCRQVPHRRRLGERSR